MGIGGSAHLTAEYRESNIRAILSSLLHRRRSGTASFSLARIETARSLSGWLTISPGDAFSGGRRGGSEGRVRQIGGVWSSVYPARYPHVISGSRF